MFKVGIFKTSGTIGRFYEIFEAETLAEVGAHVEFLNRTARFWGTNNVYTWYYRNQPDGNFEKLIVGPHEEVFNPPPK